MSVLTPAPLPSEDLVSRAERILQTPEFGPDGYSSMITAVMERLLEWIGAFVDRLFGGRGVGVSNIGGMSQVMVVLLVSLFVVLIIIVLARLLPGRRLATSSRPIRDEREAPAHVLLRLAEEAERAGDYARAFTLLFLVLLKRSDLAGILRFEPWRTNWEIIRGGLSAPGLAAFREDVHLLARRFDDVFYGGAQAMPVDVAAVKRAIADIPADPAVAA